MPDRIMFVQLKTGYDTDAGPSWISLVRFTKTWRTAHFHGRALRRITGTAYSNFDANFYDVETQERYWISGPKRDQTDARYRHHTPIVDDDARTPYEAFLAGAPLPGRERG
ncbi:hypothetical protein ACFQRL_00055 [Microbacterium fluvii]|uniref:Uncharacterized protein n=1 Tax=Microbacterium fluvii TaxID=415215 RepID=A0ABW2HD19_9MICO|nr:hypothetical protein [Microbacterium fluvii]MCU4670977.1 hypothetical protein [Microbacterium fluvii]